MWPSNQEVTNTRLDLGALRMEHWVGRPPRCDTWGCMSLWASPKTLWV